MKPAAWLLALLAAALASGCEREARRFDTQPVSSRVAATVPLGALHAGPSASAASAGIGTAARADDAAGNTEHNPYEDNAYAVSQGKRLFRWYNCAGCHGSGGGGSYGPPLMDDQWLYGHEPAQIAATIRQGRPNGMPSFAGRIPEDQIWQLVAYVRSLSGQLRSDVAPSRSDAPSAGPPEQRRDKETPRAAASASGR